MSSIVRASAPAKIILLGEHFVVHGQPAIALAIDKRATVSVNLRKDAKIWVISRKMGCSGYYIDERFRAYNGGHAAQSKLEPVYSIVKTISNISSNKSGVNVEIDSSFPISAGLGSSSAVAAATAAALGALLGIEITKKQIFEFAMNAEKIVHVNPSGVDPTVATYGGILLYQKDKGFIPMSIETDLPLVVGYTKTERSTGEMVSKVDVMRKRYPTVMRNMLKIAGDLVLRSKRALEEDDLETLGQLMDIFHSLLCAVGVSNQNLDNLVYAARKAGALGAKLTGAGGGGCMIALSKQENLAKIAHSLKLAGGEPLITSKTLEGVRVEN